LKNFIQNSLLKYFLDPIIINLHYKQFNGNKSKKIKCDPKFLFQNAHYKMVKNYNSEIPKKKTRNNLVIFSFLILLNIICNNFSCNTIVFFVVILVLLLTITIISYVKLKYRQKSNFLIIKRIKLG
jgi:hypothetical protein